MSEEFETTDNPQGDFQEDLAPRMGGINAKILAIRFVSGLFFFFVVVIAALIGFFTVASFTDKWIEAGIVYKLLIFLGSFIIGVFLPLVAAIWTRKQLMKTTLTGPWRRTMLYLVAIIIQAAFVSLIFYAGSRSPSQVGTKAQEIVKVEFGEVQFLTPALQQATVLLGDFEDDPALAEDSPIDTTDSPEEQQNELQQKEDDDGGHLAQNDSGKALTDLAEEDTPGVERELMPTPAQLAAHGQMGGHELAENLNEADRDEDVEHLGDADIVSPTSSIEGHQVVISYQDLSGAQHEKTYDIESLRFSGAATSPVHTAANGNSVTVFGGTTPVAFVPDMDTPIVLTGLKAGHEIPYTEGNTATIIEIHSLYIAMSGKVIALVTATDASNRPKKALVSSHVETPALVKVHRISGQQVPGREKAQITTLAITDVSDHGRVLVQETYRLSPDRKRSSGRSSDIHQRLLSGILDNMKFMVEKFSTEQRIPPQTGPSDRQLAIREIISAVIGDTGNIILKVELSPDGTSTLSINPLGEIEIIDSIE